MPLASWLPVPLFRRAPRLNNTSRRHAWRRPTRSRPYLEHLEDRTLLDVESVLGALGSNFAAAAIGLTEPIGTYYQTISNNGGLTSESYPNATGQTALGVASSFMAQDQSSSQHRDFSVDSEGDDYQLSVMTVNTLLYAYGFGSGTQPNAPWKPAAYNVGLANHQYGYPTETDLGFSATPPWFHRTAQSLPKDQLLDADEVVDLLTESPLDHQSAKDRGEDQLPWMEENAQDTMENKSAPTVKAEEEQAVPEQVAPDLNRGDPTMEEALFTDPLHTLSVATRSIPSPFWISALAPAQMAALVVGLPGAGTPAEGGNTMSAPAASE
jgi:hypothetical protein